MTAGAVHIKPGFVARRPRPEWPCVGFLLRCYSDPKNSLFAGSEAGARTWAILASLLQTARLNGLDPYAWLNDVLERIVSGAVRNHELDQLLAWNWKAQATARERLAA